jgi:hypothetical protein
LVRQSCGGLGGIGVEQISRVLADPRSSGPTIIRSTSKRGDRYRQWALGVQHRSNHNKAACALANKLAESAMPRCVTTNLTAPLA